MRYRSQLFSVGGLFSIYQGVHKYLHPEDLSQVWIALVVLGLAIVLEAFSLAGCLREIGPDTMLAAKIRLSPELDLATAVRCINELEASLKERVPKLGWCFIEPGVED